MVSEQREHGPSHQGLRVDLHSRNLRRILVYGVLSFIAWLALSWYPHAHAAGLATPAGTQAHPPTPAEVSAATGEPPQNGTPQPALTVSDIDAVMQQEILLKAMTQRARQRADLAKYSDGQSMGMVTPSLPRILWRRASAAGWVGKFAFDGGVSVVAGRGDMLPGGFLVIEINDKAVRVTRAGNTYDLLADDVTKPPADQGDARVSVPVGSPSVNPTLAATPLMSPVRMNDFAHRDRRNTPP